MADKKEYIIKQFRYFKAGDSRNSPEADAIWIYSPDVENDEERKHLFSDINGGVVKLGIQGLPGTIFYVNENTLDQGIIIDHTGVYELDLKDKLSKENETIYVACEGEKVLGFLFSIIENIDSRNMKPHRIFFIDDLCVDKNERNKQKLTNYLM